MTDQEIRDKLAEFTSQPIQVISATVTAVDETKQTVDVEPPSQAEIPAVRLKAAIDSTEDGIYLVPEQGSTVLIGIIANDPDTAFVLKASTITKIKFKIEGQTLEVTSNGFVINGGNLDGITKIAQVVSKLNALENDINSLKSAFSSWVVVANDGGAALKTAASSWYGSTLANTTKSDLEDENVKH